MAKATGRVVQILGGVVDVEFPEGDIPELFEAICKRLYMCFVTMNV